MYAALDPVQLRRIEGTHRGFLYQHLYAVACLLRAAEINARAIIVENDEDIEIECDDEYVYVQVKNRHSELKPSDVKNTLDHFLHIRKEHHEGRRSLAPRFVIVANQPMGHDLREWSKGGKWPEDVVFVHPGSKEVPSHRILRPWRSMREALQWCTEYASQLQSLGIKPESLVLKLASYICWKESGSEDDAPHKIEVSILPQLFEQLDILVQSFPPVPDPYYPQLGKGDEEPPLNHESRIRVIVGHGGAGKTSWASVASLHTTGRAIYYDLPEGVSNLGARLAQQISAQLLRGEQSSRVLRPGLTGTESLRVADMSIAPDDITIVLDNAHRSEAEHLLSTVSATQNIRWVILGRPSDTLRQFVGRLGIQLEQLPGWSEETIAVFFASKAMGLLPRQAKAIRQLTGGAPLFVISLATMAESMYRGAVEEMWQELERRQHISPTAQEDLLRSFVANMSAEAQHVMSILSFCRVELDISEIRSIISHALEMREEQAANIIRELFSWQILQWSGNKTIKVHDVYRLLGDEIRHRQLAGIEARLAEAYRRVLEQTQGNPERGLELLRVLEVIGDIEALVDTVSSMSEWWKEMGMLEDVSKMLIRISGRNELEWKDRFYALDSLAFFSLQEENVEEAGGLVRQMETLLHGKVASREEKMYLLTKQIILCGLRRDYSYACMVYESAKEEFEKSDIEAMVARYNLATVAYKCGEANDAADICSELVDAYCQRLDIGFQELSTMDIPSLAEKLGEEPDKRDDAKRLADCLDLMAKIGSGERSMALSIFAARLYSVAFALSSAVRARIEAANTMLYMGHASKARKYVEASLLPAIQVDRMVDWVMPIRSLYAEILGTVGDFESAYRELDALMAYDTVAQEDQYVRVASQRKLIGELERRAEERQRAGIRSISRNEFDRYECARLEGAAEVIDKVAWYANAENRIFGMIARDRGDNDWMYMVWARGHSNKLRPIDLDSCIQTLMDAEDRMCESMIRMSETGRELITVEEENVIRKREQEKNRKKRKKKRKNQRASRRKNRKS